MTHLYPIPLQTADEPVFCAVRVIRTRKAFGRVLALVEPVAGSGRFWTWEEKLRVSQG